MFNQLSLGNEGHVIIEGPPVNLQCDHGNEGGGRCWKGFYYVDAALVRVLQKTESVGCECVCVCDWMKPTHIREGNVLYSKSPTLNVNLIQKHTEISRKIFDHVFGHHSAMKLTHKINHHKYLKNICWTEEVLLFNTFKKCSSYEDSQRNCEFGISEPGIVRPSPEFCFVSSNEPWVI